MIAPYLSNVVSPRNTINACGKRRTQLAFIYFTSFPNSIGFLSNSFLASDPFGLDHSAPDSGTDSYYPHLSLCGANSKNTSCSSTSLGGSFTDISSSTSTLVYHKVNSGVVSSRMLSYRRGCMEVRILLTGDGGLDPTDSEIPGLDCSLISLCRTARTHIAAVLTDHWA